jgi:hypothetical protein
MYGLAFGLYGAGGTREPASPGWPRMGLGEIAALQLKIGGPNPSRYTEKQLMSSVITICGRMCISGDKGGVAGNIFQAQLQSGRRMRFLPSLADGQKSKTTMPIGERTLSEKYKKVYISPILLVFF